MKVVTADQMRDIEARAADIGLTSPVLMDNAGLSVAREIKKWMGSVAGSRILILAGPGNNGGDGLVAARHLHDWGAKVYVYLPRDRGDSDPNYRQVQQREIPIIPAGQMDRLDTILPASDTVVDALFGTGKARPLEGEYRDILNMVGEVRQAHPELRLVALDLPSGLNPDTGAVDPACLPCDLTITLALPKLGQFSLPGSAKVGKLAVGDIGIPTSLADDVLTEVMQEEEARPILPDRPPHANKGTFGKVLVIAGSSNYVGAAYLACTGAARVGAGLVTLAAARSLQPILAAKLTEATHLPLPEHGAGVVSAEAWQPLEEPLPTYNAILIGCGLGQAPDTSAFVKTVLFDLCSSASGLVLDADALNILSADEEWWQRLSLDAVLTPHPGEMSRLSGLSTEEIQADRPATAREMAARWNKTVVLKGAHTVIAAPDGRIRVSTAANAGLASAGTGDVLAGTIAGLIAQGVDLFDAASLGVFLHARAGERVAAELGDAGMLASDLLPVLPLVLRDLKQGTSL
jgi:NAD(P)H-hydrate epimerase